MIGEPMQSHEVSIHGNAVKISSSSPLLFDPIRRFLRYFPSKVSANNRVIDLLFYAVSTRDKIPEMRSSLAKELYSRTGATRGDAARSEWKCTVYVEPNKFIADYHDQGLVFVDFAAEKAQVYVIEPEVMHEDIRISYFHLALVELLKRRGFYTLHATALEKNGKGILIPGCSGRGKTTAFVSLLRSGYRCLSDDHPLLHDKNGALELLAFEEKVDITENSLKYFPEFHNAGHDKLRTGFWKRYFYIEDFYDDRWAMSCQPHMLLFPQIVDSPTSHVAPLKKSRALEELMPETLNIFDKNIAKQEFQFLSRLVNQLDCYELYFGHDVLELPKLIDPLLE
jgi:hypothetical protein